MYQWYDLELTEPGYCETGVDFDRDGSVSLVQDTTPDTFETQRVGLSKEQTERFIREYCQRTGFNPFA